MSDIREDIPMGDVRETRQALAKMLNLADAGSDSRAEPFWLMQVQEKQAKAELEKLENLIQSSAQKTQNSSDTLQKSASERSDDAGMSMACDTRTQSLIGTDATEAGSVLPAHLRDTTRPENEDWVAQGLHQGQMGEKTQAVADIEKNSTEAISEGNSTVRQDSEVKPEITKGALWHQWLQGSPLFGLTRLRQAWSVWRHKRADRVQQAQLANTPSQKSEKHRQWMMLAFGTVAVIFVLTIVVRMSGKPTAEKTEPVRIYQQDFRMEPAAIDKAHFEQVYEAKMDGMQDRVKQLEGALDALIAKEAAVQRKAKEENQRYRQSQSDKPSANTPMTMDGALIQEAFAVNAQTSSALQAQTKDQGSRIKRLQVSAMPKESVQTQAGQQNSEHLGPASRALATRPVNAGVDASVMRAVQGTSDSKVFANEAKVMPVGSATRPLLPATPTGKSYLPAGSFMRVRLLSGVTAATGGNAANNPVPLLMQVQNLAQLPNGVRGAVKACFLTANAAGDLSSERVWVRLDRLSCMRHDNTPIDIKVQGYLVGEDGKTGVRARLVTRSGQAIASALFTGAIAGMGKAVSLSAQTSTTYSSGAVGTTVNDAWRAGLGEGMESAMDRIVDYYLRLADKIFPVLEVDSGRQVDAVLSQGVTLTALGATNSSQVMVSTPDVNSTMRFSQKLREKEGSVQ